MNPILFWGAIVLCGGVGGMLRVLVSDAVAHRVSIRRGPVTFPVGILVVNLSGAFVLGVLDGIVLPHVAAAIVGTGLVGAYTTFSTWMLDVDQLNRTGRVRLGALDVVASLAGGLALGALGLWIGGGF